MKIRTHYTATLMRDLTRAVDGPQVSIAEGTIVELELHPTTKVKVRAWTEDGRRAWMNVPLSAIVGATLHEVRGA